MKNLILGAILLFCLEVNAQGEIIYQCKDIVQRDSISKDLLSKGYNQMRGSIDGLCVVLKPNNVFTYRNTTGENKVISKVEFYSNIIEIKKPVATLNDYLSSTDKFTGEKTYYGGGTIVSFSKYVKGKTSSQYVAIRVNGSTLNYGCYGVNILFKNGKKIIRSKEKVDSDYYNNGWQYRAFFTPTANEIALFKTQKISDVKLYIYDAAVSENESDTILEDAKILLTTSKK
jgi:hypothetical protein